VALNHAITAEYGVPGLKAAMRARGLPAGRVRRPHQPVDERTISELEELMGPLEDG
jgi:4-hydroxy-tetrahydrodipicolinate synthase